MIYLFLKHTTFTLVGIFMFFNISANSFIKGVDTIAPEELPIVDPEIYNESSFEIDEVYTIVEKMPSFKGCGDLEDIEKRKECTKIKFSDYVYSRLKYPFIAKERKIEGIVIINFKVDRKGRIFDARILKDIGAGCGKEALRIINTMNDDEPNWTAGIHQGKKVLVEMNVPVSFKLEPVGEEIPEVVENMPTFLTCDEVEAKDERRACTEQEFMKYLYQNISYPEVAINNGIEGIVVIGFVVSKTGEIVDVKILRAIGGGCEEEALKAIKSSNGKWKAGTEKGEAVSVRYRFPIRFKIPEKTKKTVEKNKRRAARKKKN